MHLFDKEPIPESLKMAYANAIRPAIRLLNKLDIHPNTFTALGFLICAVSSYFMAVGRFRLAAVLVLLGGLCDTLDGNLARDSGKVTRFGALFDSTLDRYSEVLLFFGMAYHFIERDMLLASVATAVALGGSMMVSYVRAKAESLGFECKVGVLQRPERLLLICAGGLIHPNALIAAVCVIAVLSNFTAVVRILHVWKEDQRVPASSVPPKP